MKTYLQMDGDRLVEYVEKKEYDAVVLALHDMTNLLDSEKSTRNHMIKRGAELERELNAEKQERADFGALVDKLERELNAAMEALEAIMPYIVGDKCVPWEKAQSVITKAKGEL
jgi:hypothetical protein